MVSQSPEHGLIGKQLQSSTTYEGLQKILNTTSSRKQLWKEIQQGFTFTPEIKNCINENIIIALKQLSTHADYGNIHNKNYRTICALASLHYSLNHGDIKFGIGRKSGQLAKEHVPQYLQHITKEKKDNIDGLYNSLITVGNTTNQVNMVTETTNNTDNILDDKNYLAVCQEMINQGYKISKFDTNGEVGLLIIKPIGKKIPIFPLNKETFLSTIFDQVTSIFSSGAKGNLRAMSIEVENAKEQKAKDMDQYHETQKYTLMEAIKHPNNFWSKQSDDASRLIDLIFTATYQTGPNKGSSIIKLKDLKAIEASLKSYLGARVLEYLPFMASNNKVIVSGKYLNHHSSSDTQPFSITEVINNTSKDHLDIAKIGITFNGTTTTYSAKEKGELLTMALDLSGWENCYKISKNTYELDYGFSDFSLSILGTGITYNNLTITKPIRILDNTKHITIEKNKIIITTFENKTIHIEKK